MHFVQHAPGSHALTTQKIVGVLLQVSSKLPSQFLTNVVTWLIQTAQLKTSDHPHPRTEPRQDSGKCRHRFVPLGTLHRTAHDSCQGLVWTSGTFLDPGTNLLQIWPPSLFSTHHRRRLLSKPSVGSVACLLALKKVHKKLRIHSLPVNSLASFLLIDPFSELYTLALISFLISRSSFSLDPPLLSIFSLSFYLLLLDIGLRATYISFAS